MSLSWFLICNIVLAIGIIVFKKVMLEQKFPAGSLVLCITSERLLDVSKGI